MQTVRIKQCSNHNYWYNKLVGKITEVYDRTEEDEGLLLITPHGRKMLEGYVPKTAALILDIRDIEVWPRVQRVFLHSGFKEDGADPEPWEEWP